MSVVMYGIPSWIVGVSAFILFSVICLLEHVVKSQEPKVSISDPKEDKNPKDAQGQCGRIIYLEIHNTSEVKLTNVHVKQRAFINNNNQHSDSDGQRFRRSNERGRELNLAHAQSFDIAAKDSERVDIASLNETGTDHRVLMLYAASEDGAEVRNAIPFHFFPHTLTVSVSADNTTKPVEKSFIISVTDQGILTMRAT